MRLTRAFRGQARRAARVSSQAPSFAGTSRTLESRVRTFFFGYDVA